MRQALVRAYFPDRAKALRAARQFDIWAGPLVGVVNWLGILCSAFGRHIRWRGIEYRLLRGGQVSLVRRQISPVSPAVPQKSERPLRPTPSARPVGAPAGLSAGGDWP
jgi:hypothetical protein